MEAARPPAWPSGDRRLLVPVRLPAGRLSQAAAIRFGVLLPVSVGLLAGLHGEPLP
jgi:hypothetical protein